MGLASSSASSPAMSKLARIVSLEKLDEADPIWQSLDDLDLTLGVGDLDLLETVIDSNAMEFVKNNARSGNLRTMLSQLCRQLETLDPNPSTLPSALLNLLFLCRVFLNYGILRLEPQPRAAFLAMTALPKGDDSFSSSSSTLSSSAPTHVTPASRQGSQAVSSSLLPSVRLDFSSDLKVVTLRAARRPAPATQADRALHLRLLLSLIRCLTSVRVTAMTEDLHLEVCNLLIVLCSTQAEAIRAGVGRDEPEDYADSASSLLGQVTPDEDAFLSLLSVNPELYSQAPKLVKALLRNFASGRISGTGQDEDLTGVTEASEAVAEIAAAAAESKRQAGMLPVRLLGHLVQPLRTLLWLPVHLLQLLLGRADASSQHPLADRSALLCLLLLHQGRAVSPYCTSLPVATVRTRNVYQHVLGLLEDEERASLGPSLPRLSAVTRHSSGNLSFSHLYDELAARLPQETAVLLLYSLLQSSAVFRSVILARSDLDVLVLPLLQVLYETQLSTGKSNCATVVMIILLILSQDTAAFGKHIHKQLIIRRVPWFREMYLQDVSLGSLIMIILLLMVQRNLTQNLHDRYLDTTCLATLSNLSQTCEGMHSCTARRLVVLMDLMARKLNLMVKRRSRAALSPGQANASVSDLEGSDLSEGDANLMESLRLVLEVINTCTSQANCASNSWLMYWLLIERKALKPLKAENCLWDQVGILVSTVAYFEYCVESPVSEARAALSVDATLETITARAKHWNAVQDLGEEETGSTFAYEEQERPEDFFLPYIWALIEGSTRQFSGESAFQENDSKLPAHSQATEKNTAHVHSRLLSLPQPPRGVDDLSCRTNTLEVFIDR
eukprot:gb/GEZN01002027.1/.p1 GENE.gb/GEZN01002027.1/~~gb/GEZN01002027.1/.p1  ORF type:complete len:842 (+),score=100.14 gb/GEZN01002027.1/:61-2586(+)